MSVRVIGIVGTASFSSIVSAAQRTVRIANLYTIRRSDTIATGAVPGESSITPLELR